MKLKITIALLGLLLGSTSLADDERIAPDWTLKSTTGESITLSEAVAEQPVVLVFWATWCPYCKSLMPHLQSIHLEYGEDIRVLAIHFRDDNGDPIEFMESAGYAFTVLPDGDDVAELNDAWGTPAVLVVDADMKVRFDLYSVPDYELPESKGKQNHRSKAAYLAPYWAAELRKSIDGVLAD